MSDWMRAFAGCCVLCVSFWFAGLVCIWIACKFGMNGPNSPIGVWFAVTAIGFGVLCIASIIATVCICGDTYENKEKSLHE